MQVCRLLGTRSIVAVPIASAHGTIGLLEAFSAEPHGFNDSDVRSLKMLAELILAALKPEEENRLAEISQRVVAGQFLETSSHSLENRVADADNGANSEASETDDKASVIESSLSPELFTSSTKSKRSLPEQFWSCWLYWG